MKKVTVDQIYSIMNVLDEALVLFAPGSAQTLEAINALLQAGTKLNGLIASIRDQTEENAEDVWTQVRMEYADAVAAFEQSTAPPAE